MAEPKIISTIAVDQRENNKSFVHIGRIWHTKKGGVLIFILQILGEYKFYTGRF